MGVVGVVVVVAAVLWVCLSVVVVVGVVVVVVVVAVLWVCLSVVVVVVVVVVVAVLWVCLSVVVVVLWVCLSVVVVSLRTRPSKNRKRGSGTSAGVEVYTAPGMKAHFRLAFD